MLKRLVRRWSVSLRETVGIRRLCSDFLGICKLQMVCSISGWGRITVSVESTGFNKAFAEYRKIIMTVQVLGENSCI